MFKIAICGKANSGKNTISKILSDEMYKKYPDNFSGIKYIAFADPIKKIIKTMFPKLPRKYLYGSSKFRTKIIPGAFKDGNPLTVRQLLIDIGSKMGRSYNENIWIDAFDHTFEKACNKNKSVIVTDVRFRNEFDHLKNNSFIQIKLLRDSQLKINDASETNQDTIKDSEFDFIICNNGSLDDLRREVINVISQLKG